MEVTPGRFWKGDTEWISNCFFLVVSVRFSIKRAGKSHFVGREESKFVDTYIGRTGPAKLH